MLNNFIGGGQVFLHKVRMFSQVFFRTLHVSLFVGILVTCWLNWSSAQRIDWNGFVSYKKATMALDWDDAFSGIRESLGKDPNHITYINAKSGSRVYENIDPYKVIRMSLFQRPHKEGMDFLISISVIAGAISFGCFVLVFLLWSKFGRGLKSEKKKDGSGTVLTASEVKRTLKSLKIASDLTIGNMPLVRDMETRHFLVTGSTGSGKTNWMHNILPQIENKAQPAVIVDQTGEMIGKYYNKERGDIIFNPFDERSHVWDFWADIVDDESLERFASILIGFNRKISGSRSDPFWEKSAIEIFESAVRHHKATHNKSIESLNVLIRQTNLAELRQKLTGTAAARYLESENSVTANSILSVLTTSTKPLAYLQDATGQNAFSLKRYFEGVKNGSDAWLFLATKPSNRILTLPLISCLVELALAELMDIGIDEDRRVWFVLDELAALGVLPGLSPLMTEGRKYGACVLAGLQSLNQLYEHYGHHAGSKIFGQFGTLCFFRNQEESIVRMISNMCGTETITRQSKNTSFGANEFRDGVSYNEQQTKKQLVTQNDISNLAVGECYMLLPEPEVRLAKVQTPESKIAVKNEGFMQNLTIAKKALMPVPDIVDEENGNSGIDLSVSDLEKDQNTKDSNEQEVLKSKSEKSIVY
jgi:type IV conjugative transfer system coupling protein TraD